MSLCLQHNHTSSKDFRMDKIIIILIFVELFTTLVECNTGTDTMMKSKEDKCHLESSDIDNQNKGHMSVQAGSPQLSFEVRLLKNELMQQRNDVEKLTGIDSKVDCLMSIQSDMGDLGVKLKSLENKLDNKLGDLIDEKLIKIKVNMTTLTKMMVSLKNHETGDQNNIKELQKGFTLLKQGFKGEKQTTNMKLQQISTDMKNITDVILKNVSHSLSDKLDNMAKHITDIDKSVKENEQTVQNVFAEVEHPQNVSDEMYELKTENKRISEEFLTLETKYSNMESKLNTLTDDTAMINGSCNEIFSMTQRRSAFSALVDDQTSGQPVTTTLIFDKLVFQTGTDYDVTSGDFHMPRICHLFVFSKYCIQ